MGARRSSILVLCSALLFAAAVSSAAPAAKNPETVVVLATADLDGHISPCGCKIPKGGLGRQGGYADSMRAGNAHVLFVDAGGYSAAEPLRDEYTEVTLGGLKKLGVGAVGVGEGDLRQGLSTLRARLAKAGLTAVCANLTDKSTGKPAFPPYTLQKVGPYTIGVIGLIGDRFDLGPSRDTLAVQDPAEVAARLLPEIRAAGADAVVALAQLGKVGTEDFVQTVPGIDVVVAGRGVPLMAKGKWIGDTVIGFAGEQGQYITRATLTFDPDRKVAARGIEAVMLGPEVRSHAGLAKTAAAFEEHFKKAHPDVVAPSADVHQHTH